MKQPSELHEFIWGYVNDNIPHCLLNVQPLKFQSQKVINSKMGGQCEKLPQVSKLCVMTDHISKWWKMNVHGIIKIKVNKPLH